MVRLTFRVLHLRNKVTLREASNKLVHTAAPEARYLGNQSCRDDFMVFRAHLDLSKINIIDQVYEGENSAYGREDTKFI